MSNCRENEHCIKFSFISEPGPVSTSTGRFCLKWVISSGLAHNPSPSHPIRFVSPPGDGGEENLDASVDPRDAHRYRPILDLIDPDAANPDRAECLLTPSSEPSTYAEAEGDEAWKKVMLDKLASIENQTWTLTDLLASRMPIELKWVYKLKRDADGSVVKHKARLVAEGYG